MMDIITLPVRSVKTTQSLEKTVLEVLPEDLAFCVQAISANEIDEQVRIGNKPSNILVDSSGYKPITIARRRVQAFFVDENRIKAAAEDVLRTAVLMTRYLTGAARASFEVRLNGNKLFPSVADAVRQMKQDDVVVIVGPTVPYGRKLYWRPLGTKAKNATIGGLTVRRVKRRNSGVYIVERWVNVGGERVPGIAIGMRFKGRLNG